MNNEVITVGDTFGFIAEFKPRFLTRQEIGMDETDQIVRVIAGNGTTLIISYLILAIRLFATGHVNYNQ